MAIFAAMSPLKTQISSALKLQRSASQSIVAAMITGAISSVAPMGLFPLGVSAIPLVPAGASATKSQIQNALKLQRSASPDIVAQAMAVAISVLCPIVPPVGLSALKSQISSAFKLSRSASPDIVAGIISQGIVSYFTAGGTL